MEPSVLSFSGDAIEARVKYMMEVSQNRILTALKFIRSEKRMTRHIKSYAIWNLRDINMTIPQNKCFCLSFYFLIWYNERKLF